MSIIARLGLLLLILSVALPANAAPTISTVSLQQGVAGYSGAFDRKISPNGSADGDGADTDTDVVSFFLDGGASALNDTGARQGLLRFDGVAAAVPAGAKLISATVDMVTNLSTDAQSGGAFNLYRATTAFDSTTTWASLGGDGLAGDVGEILGSFDRPAVGAPISARADQAVQAWLDGAANLGFGIRSDRTTDGWSPNTTGAATIANRPKLTINYTLDPLVDVKHYQQGVNGYAGTTDIRFNSANGATTQGSTSQELFIDGFNAANASPDQPYLLRFDGIDLNFKEIYKAELVLVTGFTSADADSPGPITVHQMLKDWNTASTYASFDSNGDTSLNNVVELLANGDVAPAAATATLMNDTEVVHMDVTSIVENWRAGQSNFGFYLATAGPDNGGTDNGWQVFVSGATNEYFRPQLRIIGVQVPEPGTSLLLIAAVVAAGACRRRG